MSEAMTQIYSQFAIKPIPVDEIYQHHLNG
jgi:hypothetical protein